MKNSEIVPVLKVADFQGEEVNEPLVIYHEFEGSSSIDTPHSHEFFTFLLFQQGSGTHTIDFIDYNVSKRQIHLLFPGQVHKWNLNNDTIGHKLIISRQLFESFSTLREFSFIKYDRHAVLDLPVDVYRKIYSEFQSIKKELGSEMVFWETIRIRSRLIALIVNRESGNVVRDHSSHNINPILYRYNILIERHFKEQKTVAFYADELNISPNYLSILCRRHFQISAIHLIHQRVVLEAKRMIHSTEKSMKEIAHELGFSDIAYFSHFFKSNTGFSPKHYRNSL